MNQTGEHWSGMCEAPDLVPVGDRSATMPGLGKSLSKAVPDKSRPYRLYKDLLQQNNNSKNTTEHQQKEISYAGGKNKNTNNAKPKG